MDLWQDVRHGFLVLVELLAGELVVKVDEGGALGRVLGLGGSHRQLGKTLSKCACAFNVHVTVREFLKLSNFGKA